ncbi:MAG: DUF4424 family protein [Myxococcales bacterium]|nr:DUF4424 family protein [Myxococcales bacterium]
MIMGKSTTVAMRRAKIVITDGVMLSYPSFVSNGPPQKLHAVRYHASYVLANRSRKRQRLKIGFPNATYTHHGIDVPFGYIRNFSVRINGKRAPVKVVTRTIKGTVFDALKLSTAVVKALVAAKLAKPIAGHASALNIAKLGRTRNTIAKRLQLARLTDKQKRALTKTLVSHYRRPSDTAIKDIEQYWHVFDVAFPPSKSIKLKIQYDSPRGYKASTQRGDYSFSYTMRTGTRWAGPIGRYTVLLVLKTRIPLRQYKVRPAGFKRAGARRLRRTWVRFVPREDVVVRVLPTK